ncbi:MAG TPA: Gfo/Idh/MocA family oxidoreductase, partial [Candidatus Acidoferrales bacterium]|nr:Gfo/Idh/MocA family oxidoreductase [Candidatus Acidoferrales bacterium]
MPTSSRRSFLAATAAFSAARAMGANDKVNIVVVGVGGRGNDHIGEYAKLPDCQIAGVCDVNQTALERAVARVTTLTGHQPKGYDDMRKVFADKSVDAVSITTPNHWHALATIWACQAGKDVYVEKPACYNVYEGQRMVEVARKTGRMVQVGTQSRSMPHQIQAMQALHSGIIGKLYLAKGLCFKRRVSIGHKADEPTPLGLNWDMFLGPAPLRPYNELRFRYNWHWFWDTGNGDIGNQGAHEMDIARWGLGDVTWPKSVVSTGGKFAYTDDQETPNTQWASFDYGDKELVFEVRGLPTGGEGGLPKSGNNYVGNLFYGTDGWMAVDSSGFQVYKGDRSELATEGKKTAGSDTGPHMTNFLKACKSRNYADLHADIAIGAMSADLCHLANASYRTGRKLNVDAAAGRFTGDGAAEANLLLTRKYRAPYVV